MNKQGHFTDLTQRSGTNYITLPITPIYWDLQSLQDCIRSQEFSAGSQAARECSELWTFHAGNALSSEPSMLGMLWTFHAGKALSSIKGLILSCKTHTDNVSTQCAHNMSLSPRKIGGQLVERVARICGEDPPIIVWAGPIRLPVS